MQCKGESMFENGGKMGKKSIVIEMMEKSTSSYGFHYAAYESWLRRFREVKGVFQSRDLNIRGNKRFKKRLHIVIICVMLLTLTGCIQMKDCSKEVTYLRVGWKLRVKNKNA